METRPSKEPARHAVENRIISRVDAKQAGSNVSDDRRSHSSVALTASILEILVYKAAITGIPLEVPVV